MYFQTDYFTEDYFVDGYFAGEGDTYAPNGLLTLMGGGFRYYTTYD